MKTATLLALLASQTIGVFSMPANSASADEAALEAECGGLGVYQPDLSDVPKDFDYNAIRKCAGHPTSLQKSQLDIDGAANNEGKRNESPDSLTKRGTCWYGDKWGCSESGWCWKRCDGNSGKWCWTAWNYGKGDWVPCVKGQSDNMCEMFKGTVKDCGKKGNGDCPDCGCKCW